MRPFALACLAEASGLAESRVTGGPCVGLVQPCLRVVPPLLVSCGAPRWGFSFTLSGGTGSVVRLAGVVPVLAAFLSDPLRQLSRSSSPPALSPSLAWSRSRSGVKSVLRRSATPRVFFCDERFSRGSGGAMAERQAWELWS